MAVVREGSAVSRDDPIVTFKRLVSGGLPPRRATRDAAGTLPVRAARFCEPITSASSFGWFIFPPISFELMFDGHGVVWTYEGAEAWYPLQSAQYPGFASEFDAAAPEEVQGFSPPFLALNQDAGVLQVWTGVIARTAKDWSLLVRAPANMLHSPGYHQFEGIIESDHWFGPLFTNIRLIQTGSPIKFYAHWPFLQVQPVRREHYSDKFLNSAVYDDGLPTMTAEDWSAYQKTVVAPNTDPERSHGAYAIAARKRRAQEQ